MTRFKALVLKQEPAFSASVDTLHLSDLKNEGDVVVRVTWSGINYKDALAVTNSGKIIRGAFPFVPGIDLAGEVESSSNPLFKKGDEVLSTGWGLGENIWGGYSQFQRLNASSLIKIPAGLTQKQAMIAGTAGLTAMLAAMEIEKGPNQNGGKYLVTGATGGVGSFSVMALSRAGYLVTAVTGKKEAHDYLQALGATEILDRSVLSNGAKHALDKALWSGCIDSVGSTTLESVLSNTERHGTVAACGLAGGADLNTSVFPFILRGVRLIGIDSNTCPNPVRSEAWKRIAELAQHVDFNALAEEITLDEVADAAQQLMEGRVTGRYVVRVS